MNERMPRTSNEERTGRTPLCDACGAPVARRAEQQRPRRHWGEVWFCEVCRARRPAAELGRLSREVALRGVPLS